MIRVIQYRNKCIGCNACVEVSSERWAISRSDGKCVLVGGTGEQGVYSALAGINELDALKKAEKNCPMRIIQIHKINQ